MKKLYSLLAVALISASSFAQTVFFSENMGTATATTAIASNTFENGTPIIFSGTADVRGSSASTGYTDASGAANVMVNAVGENFIISGINTSSYENITMSLGQRKGATAANNELTIEVSSNGTTWTPLSYTRATGTGTANWALINPTGIIPTTSTLSIRFTGTTTTEWRIDDLKLSGTAIVLGTTDIKATKNNFVKNTFVENEINFGSKADVKIYSMNGQVVKSASVSENKNLEVSDLEAGTYIVTGTVNGTPLSQKILKK